MCEHGFRWNDHSAEQLLGIGAEDAQRRLERALV
ncbi:hypothetical protein FHX47_002046 [Garicola koreensis]|uniref:Uncharacterized protein n=1 Tax=Garicola koreensis TaxID=1262554 RepID=A0A7W5TRA9_9MICC|nr:hypothetical protein [Garicola koreensis]